MHVVDLILLNHYYDWDKILQLIESDVAEGMIQGMILALQAGNSTVNSVTEDSVLI